MPPLAFDDGSKEGKKTLMSDKTVSGLMSSGEQAVVFVLRPAVRQTKGLSKL